MAHVAITCEGPNLDDLVDPRFGRTGGFLLVDTESLDTRYVDNGSSQVLAQGAGIQAAENIANAGAEVLLTGFVGPKAFAALQAAEIKVCQGIEGITAGEALERFCSGQLSFSDAPEGGKA